MPGESLSDFTVTNAVVAPEGRVFSLSRGRMQAIQAIMTGCVEFCGHPDPNARFYAVRLFLHELDQRSELRGTHCAPEPVLRCEPCDMRRDLMPPFTGN